MRKLFFNLSMLFALLLTGAQGAMASKPVLTSTDPQIGEGLTIAWGSYASMSFSLTFDQNISVVNNEPDIKLYEGDVDGTLVSPDDVWKTGSPSGNTLMVFGTDYDGYTYTFDYDNTKEYTLVIPAGMVKNAGGELNDEIVLVYNKQKVANIATISPEEGVVESLKTFTMTFPEDYAINEEVLDEGNGIYVKKVGSNEELTGTLTTFYDNTVEFELDNEITEPGDYVLYVADNYLYDMGETYDYVPAMEFNYTIEAAAEPGVFEMVSSDPANEGVLPSFWGYSTASFTLTFGENVVIKNSNPAVTFTENGNPVEGAEEWHINIGSNATDAQVWASDMDGYTLAFPLNEDATYVLTVPAGVIANAAGDLNEEIVLTFYGKEHVAEQFVTLVSSNPEDDGQFQKAWGDQVYAQFDLTFDSNVSLENQQVASIKLYEGAVGATEITPEWEEGWSANISGGNTLHIFALDEYGEGVMTFTPKVNTKYYLVVPAAIVKNGEGAYNEEITISINGAEQQEEPEVLEFVSSLPENNGEFTLDSEGKTFVSFSLTFSNEVSISSDDVVGIVKLYEGEISGTEIVPEFGTWSANMSSDKKTLNIFALDEYGEGVMTMQPKEATQYFLVVPAGIVKTSKNTENEEITIVINGPEKKEPQEEKENVTANPMNMSTVGSLKEIILTFETEETVTSNETAGEIEVINKQTDEVVTTATVVSDNSLNANEMKIELGEMITTDGVYLVKFPAARFMKGEQETLPFELQYKVSVVLGIDNATSTFGGTTIEQRFSTNGTVVNEPVKGVNILRLSDGRVVKVVVK